MMKEPRIMKNSCRATFVGCAVLLSCLVPAIALADPATIDGTYRNGELIRLTVEGRKAYLIKPTDKVDSQRRWVWVAPWSRAVNDENGNIEHRMYVDRILAAGFHVAGVDVGTSCGSPKGAEVYQKFYEQLIRDYQLNGKARLLGQSNGGLISYAWAFRHPECVERIGGIYPATDFRSWPGLEKVLQYPEPALGYGLSLDELTRRSAEFNPIDNLAPLAMVGVKIFHIHGDNDVLVPAEANTIELVASYKRLGGDAAWEPFPGLGHGGKVFFQSESLANFLVAD